MLAVALLSSVFVAVTPQPPQATQHEARLFVDRGPAGFELRITNGRDISVVLDATTLVLAGADGIAKRHRLPFERAQCVDGTWVFESKRDHEHAIRIAATQSAAGVRISLVDRLEVATSVQELSLEWQDRSKSALRWRLPYWTEEQEDIAPDVTWALPAAVGHAEASFVSIEPVVDDVTRVLPMFFATAKQSSQGGRPERQACVLGLRNFSTRAGTLFSRSANRTTTRVDELRFDHVVRFGRAGDIDGAVAKTARTLWEARPAHGRPFSVRRSIDDTIDAARRSLRSIEPPKPLAAPRTPRPRLACFASEGARRGGEVVPMQHGRRSRPLDAALAVFENAQRRGDVEAQALARGVCLLFLAAPERGGLFRTRATVNLTSGQIAWDFDERGCYSSQDCALAALALLEWADADVELRAACLQRAQRLGDFFARNRQGDGSIPARFDPELDGYRDELWSGSGETATCGRFLLELWERIPEPRYLEGAQAALTALIAARLGKSTSDRETLRFARSDAALPPRSTSSIVEAARLAFELAERSKNEAARRAGQKWLDEVLPLQQHWNPSFFDARLDGGVMRANFDSIWSDVLCVDAAHAFWLGWQVSFDPQLLQRSAAALRAPFAHAASGWGQHGQDVALSNPTTVTDRAAAARAAAVFLETSGDVIVDTVALQASAFGDCMIEGLEARGGSKLAFVLEQEAEAGRGPLRVRFARATSHYSISCNGGDVGSFAPQELDIGLSLEPRPRAHVDFRPQPAHARERDLTIQARIHGVPRDVILDVHAEVVTDEARTRFAMPIQAFDRATMTDLVTTTLPASFFSRAAEIEVRVVAAGRGIDIASPTRKLRIGESSVADCGDDDERWLVDAGASKTGPFPDGNGRGRFLDARTAPTLTYALPVDPRALTIALALRVSGSGRVEATDGSTLCTLQRRDDATWSDHRFAVIDRALFEDGRLSLRFVAEGEGLGIDWIEFRTYGRGSPASSIGQRVTPSAPKTRLVVQVLPTAIDEAFRVDREALRLAIFGSGSKRSRFHGGAPNSARSLADYLAAMSQHGFDLVGDVEAVRACPKPARAESLDAWTSAVFEAHRESVTANASPPEIWLVPHSEWRAPLRAEGDRPFVASTHEGRPVLFLPTTKDAARPLSLAKVALAIIDTIAHRDSSTFASRFGSTVLAGAKDADALPPAPLGPTLHALGWRPAVRANATNHVSIRLPPLTRDGFLLLLPIPGYDDETLYLEQRERFFADATSDDEAPGALLGSWSIPRGRVQLRAAEENVSSMPTLLPLQVDSWSIGAAVGSKLEPVRDMKVVTARGEECWSIERVRVQSDGVATFDLGFSGKSLLGSDDMLVLGSAVGRTAWVPLAVGGARGSSGVVTRVGAGAVGRLRLEFPERKESRIRLAWDRVTPRSGSRLLGRFRTTDSVMRVFVEDERKESLVAELRSRSGASFEPFAVTVPGSATAKARLIIEFEARVAGTSMAEFDGDVQLLPLSPAAVECMDLAADALDRRAVHASDGRAHAPTLKLGERDGDRIELPLRVPMSTSLLRLSWTLGERQAEANTEPRSRRFRVRFRDPRKATISSVLEEVVVTDTALEPSCIDLGPLRGRTGILVIEAGDAGPALHFTEASIRYR